MTVKTVLLVPHVRVILLWREPHLVFLVSPCPLARDPAPGPTSSGGWGWSVGVSRQPNAWVGCAERPRLSYHPTSSNNRNLQFTSLISKVTSTLKRKCTQFLAPYSGLVFQALSQGVFCSVGSVSAQNHFPPVGNSHIANQKLPFTGLYRSEQEGSHHEKGHNLAIKRCQKLCTVWFRD